MLEMPRITKKINKKRFADDIAERTGISIEEIAKLREQQH